eukprot:gnl/Trimastix_PCT/1856.p1 GENE.gnl/Trimastix_PCT/1856~~gnl/Trimastix_PCT/1856.p1  ORF type:complete len:241 (+),score=73.34 gnl/Trimastix_PCT/1856:75-797(+)
MSKAHMEIRFTKPILGAFILATGVILTCYSSAQMHGHVDTKIPFISLTGNNSPERYLYAGGLALVAYLLMFFFFVMTAVTRTRIPRGRKALHGLNWVLLVMGEVAALGFLIQSIVPLQEDAGTLHAHASSYAELKLSIQTQSVIHFTSAGVFLSLVGLHGLLYVTLIHRIGNAALARQCCIRFKLLIALATLGANVFNVLTPHAIFQYLNVFLFMLYSMSFIGDLRTVHLALRIDPESSQ